MGATEKQISRQLVEINNLTETGWSPADQKLKITAERLWNLLETEIKRPKKNTLCNGKLFFCAETHKSDICDVTRGTADVLVIYI